MSEWGPKRFWQKAEVVAEGTQYAIGLDGRPVRTPSKRQLVVPTQAMANQIAAEWEAQVEKVDPTTMPWTRRRIRRWTKCRISAAKLKCI